ncbi:MULTISPECIES: leucyl aminopeptidase family protein [unclassified Staphylococcus]|uniref:M17 family metallopeptidase n=1 Tax=unclassified Staphylococcus TaxID=91994 RepID=UPI0021D1211B|nr:MULTISPECIES: leucyl aminopeptidase family protein [unclassified Staphylococcus]UXR72128.1 leucyl aminopeptidase family protein [Staphylococcus sp. IVB6240]UXR76821.1 leucyl aminopeptidase family protein [Staphylococcus sp. IVB6233]UXR80949.1 leucyl aminopeptidase family protein [Staphylococcus sp. IVB6218]
MTTKREKEQVYVIGIPDQFNQYVTNAIPDDTLSEALQKLKKQKFIKSHLGAVSVVPVTVDDVQHKFVTVGLGNISHQEQRDYLKIGGNLFQYLQQERITEIQLYPYTFLSKSVDSQYVFQTMGIQYEQATYEFDSYRSDKVAPFELNIEWLSADEEHQQAFDQGQKLGKAINYARTLGNIPPNILTPDYLATLVQEHFEGTKVQVDVKDESAIQQEGFGLIHAVGKGSVNPPRVITLKYEGNSEQADDVIALVGKGITYDSGGYSIKSKTGMPTMKFDMCGAANVIGMVDAIANLKLKVNIVAVIAAAENMIDNNAMKPDDVFTALSGETVEVPNTDAEGRLVLGDASFYANQFAPKLIIDFATLTGAAVVALGEDKAAIFNKNADKALLQAILETANRVDEAVYELPITETERRNIKASDVADLTNHVNAHGKALFAAAFVTHFSGETPHLHVDIAGPATTTKSSYKGPKGPTGYMIPTIVNWLMTR